MHVRVGSRYTDRGGQVANIQEVMKHPGWKIRKQPDNDIALILLDRNIKYLPNNLFLSCFNMLCPDCKNTTY